DAVAGRGGGQQGEVVPVGGAAGLRHPHVAAPDHGAGAVPLGGVGAGRVVPVDPQEHVGAAPLLERLPLGVGGLVQPGRVPAGVEVHRHEAGPVLGVGAGDGVVHVGN